MTTKTRDKLEVIAFIVAVIVIMILGSIWDKKHPETEKIQTLNTITK